jgi:hypothetical protein
MKTQINQSKTPERRKLISILVKIVATVEITARYSDMIHEADIFKTQGPPNKH